MERRRIVDRRDEEEVHDGTYRLYPRYKRPGLRKQIKTRTNRRERREGQHRADRDDE